MLNGIWTTVQETWVSLYVRPQHVNIDGKRSSFDCFEHPNVLWNGESCVDAQFDKPKWWMVGLVLGRPVKCSITALLSEGERDVYCLLNDWMLSNKWWWSTFPHSKPKTQEGRRMWINTASRHCIEEGSEAICWSSFPTGSSSFGASKIPARYMTKKEPRVSLYEFILFNLHMQELL